MLNLVKRLKASGHEAEIVTVYNFQGTGLDKEVITIETPYEGPYAPAEVYDKIEDIRCICKRSKKKWRVTPHAMHVAVRIYEE